jgi:hypothetical protein
VMHWAGSLKRISSLLPSLSCGSYLFSYILSLFLLLLQSSPYDCRVSTKLDTLSEQAK